MPARNLPPLEVGQAYQAAEFERFELARLFPDAQGERKAILRLHLKNSTTIDLPTSDAELGRLAVVLTEAFGPLVIEHLRERGWI